MEPLEIRDRRFRAQQRLEQLREQAGEEEGTVPAEVDEQIRALEERIGALQEACPHEHREDDPDQGMWRCRDCDVRQELPEVAPAGAPAEA